MRHRRRTAAQGYPPIPAWFSLVPPTAPQRRSGSQTPRPPRSIPAHGLPRSCLASTGPLLLPSSPLCPDERLPLHSPHLRDSFAPSTAAVPSDFTPPLAVSPRPTPQWRSRQPLERQVNSANHRNPLPPTSVFCSRWTGALPGARRPRRPRRAAPAAASHLLRPGLAGGWEGRCAEALWGPFPTDAAWGATRGFFENLTVGTGGLDVFALHLAPSPLPSAQRWEVEAWSGKAVIGRLQWPDAQLN